MIEDYEHLIVEKTSTISETMREMDQNGLGTVFITEDGKLFGVVTDGDIRTAIIEGEKLSSPISKITNENPTVLYETDDFQAKVSEFAKDEGILRKVPRRGALKIPVLDSEKRIKDVFFFYPGEAVPKLHKKPKRSESVKSVLIVGGAGYLGSMICKKLLEKGYFVRVLDNLMFGDKGITSMNGNENFELIKGDMRNVNDLVEAIKGVDAVIHLAGLVGDPACAVKPQHTIEVNFFASKMLAEICKYNQINRFIFASSCSVYGSSSDERMLDENSELNPVSLYAEMRLLIEDHLIALKDENFLPVIFRMPTLFGASDRMRFDLVVNLFVAKAHNGEEITIFGGDQWRPFLHVSDAADYYVKALELPIREVGGRIYNIGSEELNKKITEIGVAVQKAFPSSKVRVDEAEADKRNYRVEFSKAKGVFGITPKFSIESGVKEMAGIDKAILEDYANDIYSNLKITKANVG